MSAAGRHRLPRSSVKALPGRPGETDEKRVFMTTAAARPALRSLAVGRKAWAFVDSGRGGRRDAFFDTLIVPARLSDVDLQACLADVQRATSIPSRPACHPILRRSMAPLSQDQELPGHPARFSCPPLDAPGLRLQVRLGAVAGSLKRMAT